MSSRYFRYARTVALADELGYREKWINWVTGLDWEKRNNQTTAAITATIIQIRF
jgi:hypothetical protein